MTERKSENLLKNFMTAFIAVVLFVSAVVLCGADSNIVIASDSGATIEEKATNGYYAKEYKAEDFAGFRESEKYTYPKLTSTDGRDYQEWLFAGWFKDDTCKTPVGDDVKSVDEKVYA